MKKIILVTLLGFGSQFGFSQTTATNFTSNDCASVSHTLFSELDAGKVVVLVWAMPCGACIGPSQSAYAAAQSFASSHPGRVLFWLADDYANTTCATLTGWATTNSMPNSTKFSNAVINMNDYGSTGMPKVVILGGTTHTVFYNANNSFSSSAMTTAITNALNSTTGINETINEVSSVNVFPNPAGAATQITYSLQSAGSVKVEIFNMVGQNIRTVFSGQQGAGTQSLNADCSKLNNGIYFVKISTGKLEKTIMLSVAH